ncbi:MAG: hypothetical protein AAGJ52_06675 [Pseudomonadota bacterium]
MIFRNVFFWLCFVLLASTPIAKAGTITVGSGSLLDLGGATLSNASHSLVNDGTLRLGTSFGTWQDVATNSAADTQGEDGTLELVGDWSNGGAFNPGSSLVRFIDGGTGNSQILGATTFYDLSAVTATGESLVFESGREQGVLNSLEFVGADSNLLRIFSTSPGVEGLISLVPSAAQTVDFVDVSDNHGVLQVIAPGSPAAFNSIQGPNVRGWFSTPLLFPIPTASTLGLILMALLLLAMVYTQKNKGIIR